MSNSLSDVVLFATWSHHGQRRKHSGLPYILHPLTVVQLMQIWGVKEEDLWKAALCHDILEDCPLVQTHQLEEAIGAYGLKLVQELTRPESTKGPHEPETRAIKQAYLDSWLPPEGKSIESLLIKCADRCANIADLITDNPEYALVYFQKATPIWTALRQRSKEFIDRFGAFTYNSIDSYSLKLARAAAKAASGEMSP